MVTGKPGPTISLQRSLPSTSNLALDFQFLGYSKISQYLKPRGTSHRFLRTKIETKSILCSWCIYNVSVIKYSQKGTVTPLCISCSRSILFPTSLSQILVGNFPKKLIQELGEFWCPLHCSINKALYFSPSPHHLSFHKKVAWKALYFLENLSVKTSK